MQYAGPTGYLRNVIFTTKRHLSPGHSPPCTSASHTCAMSKRLLPFGDGHASERIHALTLAALRGKATNLSDPAETGETAARVDVSTYRPRDRPADGVVGAAAATRL